MVTVAQAQIRIKTSHFSFPGQVTQLTCHVTGEFICTKRRTTSILSRTRKTRSFVICLKQDQNQHCVCLCTVCMHVCMNACIKALCIKLVWSCLSSTWYGVSTSQSNTLKMVVVPVKPNYVSVSDV